MSPLRRRRSARVVLAVRDSGINPYHAEFRDASPDAWIHPSTYLDGFPADAPALNLTLDAPDYATAIAADCNTWASAKAGVLYWIPGTRIIGAISNAGVSAPPCKGGSPLLLSDSSHGTMTTSRAAGATASLCPKCKIVFLQFSEASTTKDFAWLAKQPYLDVTTHSYFLPSGVLARVSGVGPQFDRTPIEALAARIPMLAAAGNGLLGFLGVVGNPSFYAPPQDSPGVIVVGGHDSGYVTPWSGTFPHVVADANRNPAASNASMKDVPEDGGSGTSSASPFAAGTLARLVLDARRAVGDLGTGPRDGALVLAAPGRAPATGPLSDGALTLEELKLAFLRTANPRPERDGRHDGPVCEPSPDPVCILYPTAPVPWSAVPRPIPAYYFIGYGQVDERTLAPALDALLGREPLPERPEEDRFFQIDQTLRDVWTP